MLLFQVFLRKSEKLLSEGEGQNFFQKKKKKKKSRPKSNILNQRGHSLALIFGKNKFGSNFSFSPEKFCSC